MQMVRLMVRRMRVYAGASASERFVARRVADELKLEDRVAADAIRDVTTGREYSFLVNAYYYWEGYDMVRKLCLVGMLVIAGRGSVAQLFLAVVISFMTFSLEIPVQPSKHWEDNLFKAAVEVHIFLLVSVALVLKCLRYGEGAVDEVFTIGFYELS
jgi:hypothetical protein